MEDIVYIASFDPVTNEDVRVVRNIQSYLSFEVSSITIALIKDSFSHEEVYHRQAMVKRAFPDLNVFTIDREIHNFSILKEIFPEKKIVVSYHYLRSLSFGFLTGDDSFTLLLSGMEMLDYHKESNRCLVSQIPYEGHMQESNLQSGIYLDAPLEVLNYIASNKLYFCSRLAYMEGTHRYNHSVSVANTAFQIGKNAGLNPLLCFQMGLFHDATKKFSLKQSLEIMQKAFPEYLPCPEYALHQFTGAYFAKNVFHLPTSVISPIMFHCTGRGEMTQMEKCLFIADKVEPTRFYKTKEMREIALKNLDEGFLSVLENLVQHYKEKHVNFLDNPLSIDMYTSYLNLGGEYAQEHNDKENV